jgi:hypothetical protein
MTSGVAIGWRSASVDAIGAAVVLFGLAVSFAAVIGGGFHAAGVTFPPLTGAQRGLIGMLGLVLIASGIALAWFDPGQEPSQLAGATLEDAAPRDAAETATVATSTTSTTTVPATTAAATTTSVEPFIATTIATTSTASTTAPPPVGSLADSELESEPESGPEDEALATLEAHLLGDASTMVQLDEHWVPQLSAKKHGLEWDDRYWDFRTILEEHELNRSSFEAILADGGTYNFRQGGEPMTGWFVTLVPTIANDSGPVLNWCTDHGLGRDDCFAKFVTTRQNIGSTIVLQP